jgi:hypothetical protein
MKRMRMLAGVLAATALTVGLVVAGTGAARADVFPPSPPQWAEIFNPHLTGSGRRGLLRPAAAAACIYWSQPLIFELSQYLLG